MTTQTYLENSWIKTYNATFDYSLDTLEGICKSLSQKDFCLLQSEMLDQLLKLNDGDWDAFADNWNDLKKDQYMADGGTYRERRHSTLSALPSSSVWVKEAHQPHFQSLYYNGLNGDIERHYEPIRDEVVNSRVFKSVISLGCEIFGRLSPLYPWHIEVHQFRIKAREEIPGLPTPEGIHRDGVNYILMMLIRRENVNGGRSTVYDSDKNKISEVTLVKPKSVVLLNDERTYHAVSPVFLDDVNEPGYRDMLIVTFSSKPTAREITT